MSSTQATDAPETTATPSQEPDEKEQTPETLEQRFRKLCDATPLPQLTPASIPSITPQQNEYIFSNLSGDIVVMPEDVPNDAPENLQVIQSAIRAALYHVSGEQPPSNPNPESVESTSSIEGCEQVDENQPQHRFKPIDAISTLTWDNSRSKQILDEFRQYARSSRTKTEPSSSIPSTSATQRVPSSKDKKFESKVDLVVLAAQQEAAATAMLKDVRAAHARLRKSMSTPRPGDTPIWALLAHRDSKLKPEAAAEMARARVAAAAAAAVMRDAAEKARDAEEEPNGDPDSTSDSHTSVSKMNSGLEVRSGVAPLPIPLSNLSHLSLDGDHDFVNDLESPGFPRSGASSNALHHHHPSERPRPPSSVHSPKPRPYLDDDQKKHVAFVDGTVFHMKK